VELLVSDPCVFIDCSNPQLIILVIFVDDILVTGNCINCIEEVNNHLKSKLEIRNL